ncbi:MAG: hypothetical protein KBE65_12580 [Phycisphaerae bacterium]|nr:hypothetical protein [Phycisphaerae bacterium]
MNGLRHPILITILLLICTMTLKPLCGQEIRATMPTMSPGSNVKAQTYDAALRMATGAVTEMFAPSLEMKENVDFLLVPAQFMQKALLDDKGVKECSDASIELNAPLCRTHVVLFARYWVSADYYRLSVVWAEPHAGSFNYPVYPSTLFIVSDPNQFEISHQIQQIYNGVFAKPVGARGPFMHRFNSYALSDLRFAEQETLDLFKNVESEYADSANARLLWRQRVVLPERPITVAFSNGGPAITIGGETRRYSELKTVQDKGGRQWIVDYAPVKVVSHIISLPEQITVLSGADKQVLRSARLYNYRDCPGTAEQIRTTALRFGGFDSYDTVCRGFFLKYWMRPPSDLSSADANAMQGLCEHFAESLGADATLGERLKRVNLLMQLHWMLDDTPSLEKDFREYICLLSASSLDRMILFGGQNVIETTIRWAQFRAADRLLPLWLDAAFSENDPNSLLDFASANLATKRFWTTLKLMEKVLASPAMPADRRFDAQAYHAIALSGIYQMAADPDHMIDRELDIAQVRWALIDADEKRLLAHAKASLAAAQQAYATVGKPSREHRSLKKRLDAIEQAIGANGSQENEDTDLQDN